MTYLIVRGFWRNQMLVLGLGLLLGNPELFGGQYVLSFDDAPRGDGYFTGAERTAKLISALKLAGVEEAVFYCNPRHGLAAPGDRARLLAYAEAGHILANHTADHPDANAVSAASFIDSIREADARLRDLPTYRKWFRYPFLREAERDLPKHLEIKNFLYAQGYRQGYVTVEVYDFHIDQAMRAAVSSGKKVDFAKLAALYVRVIRESLLFYDTLARETIGRSPVHVILLHENDLSALYVASLVHALREIGFVPARAPAAFADPLADSRWDFFPRSMRRVSTIAQHEGHPGPWSPPWTSTSALDALLAESGVFGDDCRTTLQQAPAAESPGGRDN